MRGRISPSISPLIVEHGTYHGLTVHVTVREEAPGSYDHSRVNPSALSLPEFVAEIATPVSVSTLA
jgi:hypothetical protein